MREVQPRDVHARHDELLERVSRLAGRTDRTDDFRSTGQHSPQDATKRTLFSAKHGGNAGSRCTRDSDDWRQFRRNHPCERRMWDARIPLRYRWYPGSCPGARAELRVGTSPDCVCRQGQFGGSDPREPLFGRMRCRCRVRKRARARARTVGRVGRISIRINPGIQIDTHAHVATGHDEAKFGVARGDLGEAYAAVDAARELRLVGLSSHIGSTQTTTEPYIAAARVLFDIVKAREAARGGLDFVDAGGGFGIDYGQGCKVAPGDFVRALLAAQRAAGLSHRLIIEPGRSLVGPFGVLVAGVIQSKVSRATDRRWLMIDAGMNDLIRPALYQARHRIEPVHAIDGVPTARFRVVGPICESSDDFGIHELPTDPLPEHVVIRDTGAYGFTMASHYNGRCLPPEIFVSRGRIASLSQRGSEIAWIESRLR